MAQPRKPRWGFRPAKPVCALRRCHPSFSGGKVAALCLASAAMQRFCDASQFLQNLCFLMSLALWEKFRKASAVGTGPRPLCLGSGPPGDVPPEEGSLPRQTTPCSFPGTSENVCSHFPHVRQISAGSLHGPVSATLPSVTLLRSSTSCVGADIRPSQRTGWIPSLWDRCVRGPGASGGNFRMTTFRRPQSGHKVLTRATERILPMLLSPSGVHGPQPAGFGKKGVKAHSQPARPAAGRSVVRDKSQCYKKGLWKLSNKGPGGQLPTRKIA